MLRCFEIVSDNRDYPSFNLPKVEIAGIALGERCRSKWLIPDGKG